MTLHQRPTQLPLPVARNRIGVAALVINPEGEVLLCHKQGHWQVPGGAAQPGEALEHTVERELLESAQLQASTPFLLTLLSGPRTLTRLPSGGEVYDFTAVYVVREWQGTPDGQQVRFYQLDGLPTNLRPRDLDALHELRLCWGMD